MSYSPTLMRWMQADPIGYVDGLNRDQAFVSNPIGLVDPTGTTVTFGADDGASDYLKRNNVSAKGFDDAGASFTGDSNLAGQIIAGLISSKDNYRFADLKAFQREVDRRMNNVDLSRNGVKAGFGADKDLALPDSWNGLSIKNIGRIVEALEAALKRRESKMACQPATAMVYLLGAANAGIDVAGAAGERRGTDAERGDLMGITEYVRRVFYPVDDYKPIPGDWIWSKNTDPNTNKDPATQGQNFIYLGGPKNEVWAFGHGIMSLGDLKNTLGPNYAWKNKIANPTKDEDILFKVIVWNTKVRG